MNQTCQRSLWIKTGRQAIAQSAKHAANLYQSATMKACLQPICSVLVVKGRTRPIEHVNIKGMS